MRTRSKSARKLRLVGCACAAIPRTDASAADQARLVDFFRAIWIHRLANGGVSNSV